jgi:hypothetical protein
MHPKHRIAGDQEDRRYVAIPDIGYIDTGPPLLTFPVVEKDCR